MSKRECCKKKDNLEPAHQSTSADTIMVEMICQVCGRSHYIASAHAKRYGVKGRDG